MVRIFAPFCLNCWSRYSSSWRWTPQYLALVTKFILSDDIQLLFYGDNDVPSMWSLLVIVVTLLWSIIASSVPVCLYVCLYVRYQFKWTPVGVQRAPATAVQSCNWLAAFRVRYKSRRRGGLIAIPDCLCLVVLNWSILENVGCVTKVQQNLFAGRKTRPTSSTKVDFKRYSWMKSRRRRRRTRKPNSRPSLLCTRPVQLLLLSFIHTAPNLRCHCFI